MRVPSYHWSGRDATLSGQDPKPEVAREAGIHTSQLFRWRHEMCLPAARPAFSPVAVLLEPGAVPPPASSEPVGVIEIEFSSGGWMRITGAVEASTLSALMKALASRR
jgi:transposase